MDFTGIKVSAPAGEPRLQESNDACGSCDPADGVPPLNTCSPHLTNGKTLDLEESLSTLGHRTESLIRNMRLDNVVLQSRNEHMKFVLRRLDDELRALENMIVESSAEGTCEEEQKKEYRGERQNPGNRLASTSSDAIHSSADWAESPSKETRFNDISRSKTESAHDLSFFSNKKNFVGNGSSPDGLDGFALPNIANSRSNKNVLPLRRMFRWGVRDTESDQQLLTSSAGSTASESNSLTSVPRWPLKDNRRSSNMELSTSHLGSKLSVENSVNSSGLLQWLVDSNGRRRRHTVQEMANNDLLHRTVQMSEVNCKDPQLNIALKSVEKKKEESSSNRTNSNRCQPNAHCTKLSHSEMRENLHLKLCGCDLAKSSLQELHCLQARSLLDLQRDHALAEIESDIESHRIHQELENLRTQHAYCQKENKRKQRLLKEAKSKVTKASDREEVLLEEVECVRTELFALNQELSKKGLLPIGKMLEET